MLAALWRLSGDGLGGSLRQPAVACLFLCLSGGEKEGGLGGNLRAMVPPKPWRIDRHSFYSEVIGRVNSWRIRNGLTPPGEITHTGRRKPRTPPPHPETLGRGGPGYAALGGLPAARAADPGPPRPGRRGLGGGGYGRLARPRPPSRGADAQSRRRVARVGGPPAF